MAIVTITAVTHRPSDKMGSYSDKIINNVENVGWTHVYPKININNKIDCWNILGFFKPWEKIDHEIVDRSYVKIKEWSFFISDDLAKKLETYWDNLIGRGYGVGKLIFLPLFRLTGWKWITKLTGLICSGAVAQGLNHINFISDDEPEMFGLKELETSLNAKTQN
jgi:hypothetical protein